MCFQRFSCWMQDVSPFLKSILSLFAGSFKDSSKLNPGLVFTHLKVKVNFIIPEGQFRFAISSE